MHVPKSNPGDELSYLRAMARAPGRRKRRNRHKAKNASWRSGAVGAGGDWQWSYMIELNDC